MKKYTIEISPYPQEFIVDGKDNHEAIEKARQRFYDKNMGISIYETKILNIEEL
jgi:hypothetical protein